MVSPYAYIFIVKIKNISEGPKNYDIHAGYFKKRICTAFAIGCIYIKTPLAIPIHDIPFPRSVMNSESLQFRQNKSKR